MCCLISDLINIISVVSIPSSVLFSLPIPPCLTPHIPLLPFHKTHLNTHFQACGFEILVCSAGGVTPTTPTTTSAPTQPHAAPDPRWLRYHKALMEKGYYRVGRVIGSPLCVYSNTPLHLLPSPSAPTLTPSTLSHPLPSLYPG